MKRKLIKIIIIAILLGVAGIYRDEIMDAISRERDQWREQWTAKSEEPVANENRMSTRVAEINAAADLTSGIGAGTASASGAHSGKRARKVVDRTQGRD